MKILQIFILLVFYSFVDEISCLRKATAPLIPPLGAQLILIINLKSALFQDNKLTCKIEKIRNDLW